MCGRACVDMYWSSLKGALHLASHQKKPQKALPAACDQHTTKTKVQDDLLSWWWVQKWSKSFSLTLSQVDPFQQDRTPWYIIVAPLQTRARGKCPTIGHILTFTTRTPHPPQFDRFPKNIHWEKWLSCDQCNIYNVTHIMSPFPQDELKYIFIYLLIYLLFISLNIKFIWFKRDKSQTKRTKTLLIMAHDG